MENACLVCYGTKVVSESAEFRELLREAREIVAWEAVVSGELLPDVPVVAAPEGVSEYATPSACANRRARLAVLESEARTCQRCELHRGRTKSVFARGNPDAELVFVGEGPGYHEDQQGIPFVGPAGQLLDKMIAAMGFGQDEIYICNVVKCRPPENRTPLPPEAAACSPFLRDQIEAIAPKVIVALGKCAAQNLGCASEGKWRGIWREWNGVPVMPTYHPAFLLRSPEFKRPVWEDLQRVIERLGRTAPKGRSG